MQTTLNTGKETQMKLIRYRDAGMHTHTYFWTDSNHRVASPYFDTEQKAQEWYNNNLTPLILAAKNMSDKGYELSTLEKQAEFAKNRNYPEWDEWKAIK